MHTLTEAEQLIRRIAPELADDPFYLVSNADPDLAPEFRCYGCLAFTAPWLDLALASHLRDRGRWYGRGPLILVNVCTLAADADQDAAGDASLAADADQDAAGDASLAAELYRGRLTAVLVHELAHVLQQPIDRTEVEDLVRTSRAATAVVRRWSRDEYTPPAAPWHGHSGDWLRILAHVTHRAERLTGERLPTPYLCHHRSYRLSFFGVYQSELGDEPETLQDQSFAAVRAARPPEAFVRLWRSDVIRWFQSLPGPSSSVDFGTALAAAVRLFSTGELEE